MHQTAEEFRKQANNQHGLNIDIREFDEETKTAEDAAAAIGCDLAQIIKSIIMHVDGQPVLVLTGGHHRIDESKLADEYSVDSDQVRTATAEEVTAATGWSIGGVPPLCHESDLPIFADPVFTSHETLWGAAGTPDTMFPLTSGQLDKFADLQYVDVYE